jgi:hypothetical protein
MESEATIVKMKECYVNTSTHGSLCSTIPRSSTRCQTCRPIWTEPIAH